VESVLQINQGCGQCASARACKGSAWSAQRNAALNPRAASDDSIGLTDKLAEEFANVLFLQVQYGLCRTGSLRCYWRFIEGRYLPAKGLAVPHFRVLGMT
jgi:hypothetical protein